MQNESSKDVFDVKDLGPSELEKVNQVALEYQRTFYCFFEIMLKKGDDVRIECLGYMAGLQSCIIDYINTSKGSQEVKKAMLDGVVKGLREGFKKYPDGVNK